MIDLVTRLRTVARQKREDLHKTTIVMSGDGDLYDEAANAVETGLQCLTACREMFIARGEQKLADLVGRDMERMRK